MQIQIRLLLQEQYDQGLHCLSFPSASFECITAASKSRCLSVGQLPELILGVPIFRIFVQPACSEQDIIVTTLVQCMCGCECIVLPSRFVQAIASTFMHGFQNNLAQLLSSSSRSAI